MLDQPLPNSNGIAAHRVHGNTFGAAARYRQRGAQVTPWHHRIGAPLGSLGVVLALLALTTACGPAKQQPNQSSPSAAPATPAAPVSPSPAAAAGAATALDAYRQAWKAYVNAIKIPDPSFPDLARYMQGDALKLFTDGLTQVKSQGLVGTGEITINPSVVASMPNATPPSADIVDCADTSKSHLVKADGSAYQDTPGGKRKVSAAAVQQPDGSWKVSAIAVFDVGTC
ncbi:MAG TPA: hypothetical protein VFC19_02595 [Candidatus Limnocylindrales bacterium]|nr:hypothetical protein [Candidatus Limnocylindrales bacterium]